MRYNKLLIKLLLLGFIGIFSHCGIYPRVLVKKDTTQYTSQEEKLAREQEKRAQRENSRSKIPRSKKIRFVNTPVSVSDKRPAYKRKNARGDSSKKNKKKNNRKKITQRKSNSSKSINKKGTNNNPNDETFAYIKKFKNTAIKEMRDYGIPASITLAQGILESARGTSTLSTKGNNHFGIKCHSWKGPRIYHDDDEKNECFRKYKNANSSYRDHSLFLHNNPGRYAFLFKIKNHNYRKWAHGLKKAGYATDPTYAVRLIDLIERYELYKYDGNKKIEKTPNEPPSPIIYTSKKPSAEGTHVVQIGDTLFSISRKYNIDVAELKKLNNLTNNNIKVGQTLLVKP